MNNTIQEMPAMNLMDRRSFLGTIAITAATAMRTSIAGQPELKFDLSLVETSLSRSLADKTVDHLDLASIAKNEFGIEAVEYASECFPEKSPPNEHDLREMNKRAAEHGIRQLLIAIENDVRIGDASEVKRMIAGQRVRQWIDVARALGCHSVQINPASDGETTDQHKRAVDALASLCEYADIRKINVLLGNYGGASANAEWVSGVIKAVDSPCCRTLPRIKNLKDDADYQNLAKLIPLAKGMTADTMSFDEQGNETTIDYVRAMRSVHEAGYRGYVGVNFRGNELDEMKGIQATILLLQRIQKDRK